MFYAHAFKRSWSMFSSQSSKTGAFVSLFLLVPSKTANAKVAIASINIRIIITKAIKHNPKAFSSYEDI